MPGEGVLVWLLTRWSDVWFIRLTIRLTWCHQSLNMLHLTEVNCSEILLS